MFHSTVATHKPGTPTMKLTIAAIAIATFAQASAAPATSSAPQVSRDHEASDISANLLIIYRQPATVPNCGYPTLPLLRAWSKTGTDHFYTTNTTEMDSYLANGYTSQGIAAYILPSDTQAPTAVPLFRMYSAKSIDHYYTTNTTQRALLIQQGNYLSDGIAGFVYPEEECGTVPLYRIYKHTIGDNFFTTDQAEVYDFVNQLGYTYMGIYAYVNSQ